MKTKVYSRCLPVTTQDKKFYHVVAKIVADYEAYNLTRAVIFRVKETSTGFIIEKKPSLGRLYSVYKKIETLEGALESIERYLHLHSPEYRAEANRALNEALNRNKDKG